MPAHPSDQAEIYVSPETLAFNRQAILAQIEARESAQRDNRKAAFTLLSSILNDLNTETPEDITIQVQDDQDDFKQIFFTVEDFSGTANHVIYLKQKYNSNDIIFYYRENTLRPEPPKGHTSLTYKMDKFTHTNNPFLVFQAIKALFLKNYGENLQYQSATGEWYGETIALNTVQTKYFKGNGGLNILGAQIIPQTFTPRPFKS